MSEWQKCPICGGCGLVGGGYFDTPGFIDEYGNRQWASDHASESCRRCDGIGTIKTPDEAEEYKKATTVEFTPDDVIGE